MITDSENLVSLEELQYVLNTYAGPPNPRTRPAPERIRRFRSLAIVAALTAVLALAGVAIADGFGAFSGISAAQHPQTGADVIDPVTQAYMEGQNCSHLPDGPPPHCMPVIAGLLFNTARVVGQIPSGQNIYVITTKSSGLCFVVGPPSPEWNCDDPLSASHPSTVFAYTQGEGPWTLVGVALDGVSTVSFDEDGHGITVPVEDNVWTYQTESPDPLYGPMASLTAHFADGETVVQTH